MIHQINNSSNILIRYHILYVCCKKWMISNRFIDDRKIRCYANPKPFFGSHVRLEMKNGVGTLIETWMTDDKGGCGKFQ